jgi:hypothetical protein
MIGTALEHGNIFPTHLFLPQPLFPVPFRSVLTRQQKNTPNVIKLMSYQFSKKTLDIAFFK